LEIFRTRREVHNYLKKVRSAGKTIGLVPTMGALHAGHLSLIEAARRKTEVVVCSIFVNPTQFNDEKDLENYPRPIEEDIRKLREADCSVLFAPQTEEIYHNDEHWHIGLEGLDLMLEGEIRPGHYQGVTQVVKKLFDIIEPDYAFFGQKDYQQFMVVSCMVRKLGIKVKLVQCPIVREEGGLAMSSRNVYLTPEDRKNALALFRALSKAKAEFNSRPLTGLREDIIAFLDSCPGIETEYFEICNAKTLRPVTSKKAANIIALAAAKVGRIRIIDNMMLKQQ